MNAGDASNFVSALLGEAVVFLLLMAAASMLALFKGASELRRLFRTNSSDYTKLLLKSPLVPQVWGVHTMRLMFILPPAMVMLVVPSER